MPRDTGHVARRRFGQHFLVDSFVVDEIIALIDPRAADRILEIGPGEGVLTERLVSSGAEVVAVEIDRDLARVLERRFGDAGNLELHCADILKYDFGALAGPPRGWKVAGNLPYNISTPLLSRLLAHAERFSRLVLMLQKEVADRLAAVPGTKAYGRLSVLTQHRCEVRRQLTVGPDCFRPAPRVDSAVIELAPRADPDDPGLEQWLSTVVRKAFATRRKTLANTLRGCIGRAELTRCAIDPGLRAEQLSVDDFVRLARATRGRRDERA